MLKFVKILKLALAKKFYRIEVWMHCGNGKGKLVIHYAASRKEVSDWIRCYDYQDDIRVVNLFGKEIYRDWSYERNDVGCYDISNHDLVALHH